MLAKILTNTFWNFYDHLGLLLLGNIIALGILSPALLWLAIGLARHPGVFEEHGLQLLAALYATVPIGLAGLGALCHKLVFEEGACWKDFFVGIKRFSLKAYLTFALDLFVLAVLVSNIFFSARWREERPLGALFLGGIALWILIAVVLANQYVLPLVALGEGPIAAFTKALRLVGAHPLVSLGLFVETLCVAILATVSVIGVAIFLLSGTVLLQTEAVRVLKLATERRVNDIPDLSHGRTVRGILSPPKGG